MTALSTTFFTKTRLPFKTISPILIVSRNVNSSTFMQMILVLWTKRFLAIWYAWFQYFVIGMILSQHTLWFIRCSFCRFYMLMLNYCSKWGCASKVRTWLTHIIVRILLFIRIHLNINICVVIIIILVPWITFAHTRGRLIP